MTTNTAVADNPTVPERCCPPFDPDPWQDRELTWDKKLFVTDHVTAFCHIPLNITSKVTQNVAQMETAGALTPDFMMLSDESSLWGSEIYLSATRPVPNAKMAEFSGTFLTKVFEGPYQNAGKWCRTMQAYVKSKGKTIQKIYFYYTTCPKCARAYGKNYVVLFAQVG